jgi:CheY-like chemotaxis protein
MVPASSETVVLLVDDDPAILELFSVGLQEHGFRVVKAGTAAVALQRARELGRVDILVTDVVLVSHLQLRSAHHTPAMQGIELMRRFMAAQPDAKVILFSGQSKDTIKQVGGIPPGTTFLEKPFSVNTLVRTIKQLLSV